MGLQVWKSTPADKYFVLLPGQRASVYVVDVHGRRRVFLVGQLYGVCRDLTEAEEVVAEAFARAVQHRRTFVRLDNPEVAAHGRRRRQPHPCAPTQAARRPRARAGHATPNRVIEHGLVFDPDRDGAADCQIGIHTDAPKRGQLRVGVKNLSTGVTDEKVGGPYGVPFDFAHPSESTAEPPLDVSIVFLYGARKACVFPNTVGFYAYASITEKGRVTEGTMHRTTRGSN